MTVVVNVASVIGEVTTIEKAALDLATYIIMKRLQVNDLLLETTKVPPEILTMTFTNTLTSELIRYFPISEINYLAWTSGRFGEAARMHSLVGFFLQNEANKKLTDTVLTKISPTGRERKEFPKMVLGDFPVQVSSPKWQKIDFDYSTMEERVLARLVESGIDPEYALSLLQGQPWLEKMKKEKE